MTEEQIKFYFILIYKLIKDYPGVTFGELVDYGAKRKLQDDLFLAMLDQMESSGLAIRKGEQFYVEGVEALAPYLSPAQQESKNG
jgi:hypothetical protein